MLNKIKECIRRLIKLLLELIFGKKEPDLTPFQVHSTDPTFIAPVIRLHFDPDYGITASWEDVRSKGEPKDHRVADNKSQLVHTFNAIEYLRDAIERMTGRSLDVVDGKDFSSGINFVLWKGAPPDIENDQEIRNALNEDGPQKTSDREAYYIRSEKKRVLIVARTVAGLCQGSVSLIESTGYEVLGMGPNWTHVPDFTNGLSFTVRESGRPSCTFRNFFPTNNQWYNNGTISLQHQQPQISLTDAADEYVSDSYWRWTFGSRTQLISAEPFFLGHKLQNHHREIVAEMVRQGLNTGFLAKDIIGFGSTRPPASSTNNGHLWIDSTTAKVHILNGTKWEEYLRTTLRGSIDITANLVRQYLRQDMIDKAEEHFTNNPDELFIYGMEPEDGRSNYADFGVNASEPDWYSKYRINIGKPLDTQAYRLDGLFGIEQEKESFDPNLPANHVFALSDWLLHEFDRYIELPTSEKFTSTGLHKTKQIRMSFYSYNFHDVPPEFNPDDRIKLLIHDKYRKYFGKDKWVRLDTIERMIEAFKKLIPGAVIGYYQLRSFALIRDNSIAGILDNHDASPKGIVDFYGNLFSIGAHNIQLEVDFNFGKQGLAYYLTAKYLWNTNLSADDLNILRQRFLQRAYGPIWETMEKYYDSLLLNQRLFNGIGVWSAAIQLLVQAQAELDAIPDIDSTIQRRLDDIKQYWYFYFLIDTDPRINKDDPNTPAIPPTPAMQTFAWKGQMSYMTAMHMALKILFYKDTRNTKDLLASVNKGPAHYTSEETAIWWADVVAHWSPVPVDHFEKVILNNGIRGADVDQNDMVSVAEFEAANTALHLKNQQAFYHPFNQFPFKIYQYASAGNELGFSMGWQESPEQGQNRREVTYGVERYDPIQKKWSTLVKYGSEFLLSDRLEVACGSKYPLQIVRLKYRALDPGTYRILINSGFNGYETFLAGSSLSFDEEICDSERPQTFTFSGVYDGNTHSTSMYFYIPKGLTHLDFELLKLSTKVEFTFYTRGILTGEAFTSRPVNNNTENINKMGAQSIMLEPNEAGSIVGLNFGDTRPKFPYLYNIPLRWAKTPAALMVPRAIAIADGLTIIE